MPKTKSLIDCFKESITDFHKRKIKTLFSEMVKNGERITPPKLLARAHITDKSYKKCYYDYINELLDT